MTTVEKLKSRWWVGVAAGMALGLGSVVAVNVATDDAQAAPVRVSAEQLLINQRISSAAVLRANESLRLLAPIRPDAKQPSKVLGWAAAAIRDGAITTSKLADDAVTTAKIADKAVGTSQLSDGLREGQPRWAVVSAANGNLVRGRGASTADKLNTIGFYTVTFDRDVSACAFQATIADPGTTVIPTGQISAWRNPNDAKVVTVRTATAAGADTNALPFQLTVLC